MVRRVGLAASLNKREYLGNALVTEGMKSESVTDSVPNRPKNATTTQASPRSCRKAKEQKLGGAGGATDEERKPA